MEKHGWWKHRRTLAFRGYTTWCDNSWCTNLPDSSPKPGKHMFLKPHISPLLCPQQNTNPTGPIHPSPALSHLPPGTQGWGWRVAMDVTISLVLWWEGNSWTPNGRTVIIVASQERKGLFLRKWRSGWVATSDSLQMHPAVCQCCHCKTRGVCTCQETRGHLT